MGAMFDASVNVNRAALVGIVDLFSNAPGTCMSSESPGGRRLRRRCLGEMQPTSSAARIQIPMWNSAWWRSARHYVSRSDREPALKRLARIAEEV